MKKLKTPENTDSLIQVLNKLYPLLDTFIMEEFKRQQEGKKYDLLQVTVNQHFGRTMLNVKALVSLLELYKKQRGMVYPIGLILRGIFSDFITLCYLLTFCENDRIVTESFKNEFNLFNRDGLRSFIQMMEIEANLAEYFPKPPPDFQGKEAIYKRIHYLKSETYKLFFDKNAKWKSVKELRSTSDKALFAKYDTPFDRPDHFVSENYKWTRMEKDKSFKKYILVFFGYKVFSQFQHYSSVSMQLLQKEQADFLYYYVMTGIDSIFIVTDLHIQILDRPDSSVLKEIRKIKDEIDLNFKEKEAE